MRNIVQLAVGLLETLSDNIRTDDDHRVCCSNYEECIKSSEQIRPSRFCEGFVGMKAQYIVIVLLMILPSTVLECDPPQCVCYGS